MNDSLWNRKIYVTRNPIMREIVSGKKYLDKTRCFRAVKLDPVP